MADTFMIGNRFPKVAFGTSGVRALLSDLNAQAVFAYVFAFMQRMREGQMLADDATVAVGMDLRPSSPGIAAAVCGALRVLGFKADFPCRVDTTDSERLTFADGDVVHLRASGNPPELHCYAEASGPDQARALCMGVLGGVR